MVLLSEIVGARLIDAKGAHVGAVCDLIADSTHLFPQIRTFLVKRGRRRIYINAEHVETSTPSVVLRVSWRDAEISPDSAGDLYLARDVLDQQIIDIQQYKIVRVNDVTLVPGDQGLLVAGVDASFRGLLRRLKLERMADFIARLLHLTLHTTFIGWNQVEVLQTEQGGVIKLKVPVEKLKRLHPHDLAAVVSHLDPTERAEVFQSLDVETAADALPEIEPEVQVSIIESLEEERAADILSEMEPDEAADLLGDLPHDRSEELLEKMDEEEAEDVKELLRYDDDTAGGLMTNDFASIPVHLAAKQVIEMLRTHGTIDHEMYYVYVVDDKERLVGVFSLGALLTADADAPVTSFMTMDPIRVRPDMSAEEASQAIARYDLLAVPVVDNDDGLLGIVTIDDVIELMIPPDWKHSFPRVFRSGLRAGNRE